MAIDATVQGSPGWWMQKMYDLLRKRNRDRLDKLFAYYDGTPPIIFGSNDTRSAFAQFQRSSRTNFAELIVQAKVDKMKVRAIRTGADGDESGDPEAMKTWRYNGLDARQAEVYEWRKVFGESYVSVGIEPGDEYATICPEDPRQVITLQHPTRPWEPTAAFKLFCDDAAERDYAYLWLPAAKGEDKATLWVASAQRVYTGRKTRGPQFGLASFDMAPFEDEVADPATYDGPLSARYPADVGVPVFRFENRRCVGEYEKHTDLLDRITHVILQRLVIITMQAFRQRAIELTEDLPETDPETGEKIDYDKVFSADPGALWKLPAGSKIWESAQAELTGILQAAMDDIKQLSSVTKTPLPMLMPDGANQTAEGATNQADTQISAIEHDQQADTTSWALAFACAFRMKGDSKRADVAEIRVDWYPAKRVGIMEAAQADAASTLPFEDKLRLIYQMTPDQIAAAKTNRSDDLAFQAAMQAVAAPPTPPALPSGTIQGEVVKPGQQQQGQGQQGGQQPPPQPVTGRGNGQQQGQ